MKKKRLKIKVSRVFIIIFFLALISAIVKLNYVALSKEVDDINLTEFASKRNTVKKTLYASRGNIYDINGETIAQNVNSYTLIAYLSETRTEDEENPQHVVDKEKTAKELAKVLKLDYKYILNRLNTKGAYQVEFGSKGSNISENKKVEIDALNLPGIDFIEGNKRYYKNSRMASYIVGYAKTHEDGEISGEMGIESYYDNELKGKNGYKEYQRDAYGYQMGDAYTIDPVSGKDIYLTLDTGIQLILEDAVYELEESSEFAWFTINVMNAKTGAIVGSASSPNYNPNTLEDLTNYVNPLVGYTYEPGSTMKIFSWLAAMENGNYKGDEKFLSGHKILKDGTRISDFNRAGWGEITYDTGFAYSSNVGATNLALELGSTKLREYYESLGFGAKTGIDLPGEEKGLIRLTYESELASASFGQGITTTPIETLQALTILTNDGIMLKPYIIDKIVDDKGNVVKKGTRTELGRKASSESIKKMNSLMYDVVYNGLSEMWQTKNVSLSGKTGTAQIASATGGYLTGSSDYIRSFAGIFPSEDPEYIIYASVKQINNGAAALAKVVTKAVESIANYANITEKEEEIKKDKIVSLSNYISDDVKITVEELKRLNLNVVVLGSGKTVINQFPLKNTMIFKGSKVFLKTDKNDYVMPDIMGWSSSEVMNFCNLIGLKYKFNGYGKVKKSSIPKNTAINIKNTLEVTLSNE